MNPARAWPLGIVGLLLLNATIVGITVYASQHDSGFAVEPDYYRRGLTWDDSARQQVMNRALGWKVDCRLAPEGAQTALVATITDGADRPIRTATVHVEAFHESLPGQAQRLVLLPSSDGVYSAVIQDPHPGLWRLRVSVDAAETLYTSELQMDVSRTPAGPGGRACSR